LFADEYNWPSGSNHDRTQVPNAFFGRVSRVGKLTATLAKKNTMTKKNAFFIILALLFILCHWYFGTKVFTLYSYPIFNKQHWYAELLKTWIHDEDKARLRVWKDTIPVFMNESDIVLPKVEGFTIISLSRKSALWNSYRNRRLCQIIEAKVHHNLMGREIKLRIRDDYLGDTAAFDMTKSRISAPRDFNFLLIGIKYKWLIQKDTMPSAD